MNPFEQPKNIQQYPSLEENPSQPQMVYQHPNIPQQPQYVQPQLLVQNQMNPHPDVLMLPNILKTDSRTVVCPYCKKVGFTRTEKQCNMKSALVGLLCGVHIWMGIQVLREKDISCYDSTHYCQYCGSILVKYESM